MLRNLYKTLYKTFYYNHFVYVVHAPLETVIEQLDHLFREKSGLFKSPNLSGRFISFPGSFRMTAKWSLGIIQNFEKDPAILKGLLSSAGDTKTRIDISIRPNSVFLILSIFFLPIGLYNLYQAATTKDANSLLIGLWMTFVAIPVLFFFARGASNALRKNFQQYMNVRPASEDELL
ncbi:hypothetical protein WG954_15830 [Lacibacter sp. H375]|uniref:hypothetical protein n=1 Tax=Lacibacter sp. H375 TaxID=3133424 RepID=UPI0030BB390C